LIICCSTPYNAYIGDGSFLLSGKVIFGVFSGSVFFERDQSNESAQDFFGDWQNYKGYSDVGYYIGCEFVKFLRQKYSMDELANMEIDVVFYNLCKYVSKPEVVTE